MTNPPFGLYGILTKPKIGYARLAKIMCQQKVRYIQLRIKDKPTSEILDIARELRSIIAPPSLLIINDDPEIAREVGADGVHLGQDDAPYRQVRDQLGKEAIIGLSTHNPEQTKAACALGPDYIGIGPVYATPTKAIPDPVIGIDGLKAMLACATVPAVVIGGIDHQNVREVLSAGAQNLCAVRCINQADDPDGAIGQLQQVIKNFAHR